MYRTTEIPKRSGVGHNRRRKVDRRKWKTSRFWPWVFYRTRWPELAAMTQRRLNRKGYLAAIIERYCSIERAGGGKYPYALEFIVVGIRPGFRWLISFLAIIDTLQLLFIGPNEPNKITFAEMDDNLRWVHKSTNTSQRRKKPNRKEGCDEI